MEDIKRILVVSRMTRYCRKAVHYGVSLSSKFGAELFVIHVVHDPLIFGAWNLPKPSLEREYEKELVRAKEELDEIIKEERVRGMSITEVIKEGEPVKEIFEMVEKEKIDLLIMLAHEEWRLEHLLFGRSKDELIRKMPCSVLLVKQEPSQASF